MSTVDSIKTLQSRTGITVQISDKGGAIRSVQAPDRNGRFSAICLEYGHLHDYIDDPAYFGVLIGRVANRISNSRFTIDGKVYVLKPNEGAHHLHGGDAGLSRVDWKTNTGKDGAGEWIDLHHTSRDGTGGYPGNLSIHARYQLSPTGCLSLSFSARTDQTTPVALTHHPYWNLAGTGSVHDHILQVFGEHLTEIDGDKLPTGRLSQVAGTPFDLRQPTRLGPVIEATGGLDHNYAIDGTVGQRRPAAVLYHPGSGRRLRIETTLPGLQIYTGGGPSDRMDTTGKPFVPSGAICLEPQFFPDAVNQPHFASPLLRPEDEWAHEIHCIFDVMDSNRAST